MDSCPEPELLALFAEGRAPEADHERLRTHVDGCASCCEVLVLLATTSRPGSPASPAPTSPAGPLFAGRYKLNETLGAGAMGLVISAHDVKLDRVVALKLVRPDLLRGDATAARDRLLREAKLMAKVRHENVVTVYDAGADQEQIFIAMEHVDGESLRGWLEAGHPWREILDVFIRAGRGLCAAHAAGVVHRDFKPDNVLISSRREVRVSDFGLAWSHLGPRDSNDSVGTPAYMAPEQMRADPLDPRADQFSFCAALFEALHGARPFEGDTIPSLLASIEAGRIRPEKPGTARWLREVVRRGLSSQPGQRFASLEELLARLERGRRRVVRWVVAGTSLCLLLGAAGYAAGREPPCVDPSPRLGGVWDPPRREAVRAAFLATRAPFADEAWRSVATNLEAYATAWSTGYRTACEQTRVAHATHEDVYAGQTTCFEERFDELQALSELFSRADREVVENAVAAVERLGDLGPCARGEPSPMVPMPADRQAQLGISQARLEIARVDTLSAAGKFHDAARLGGEAVARAKHTGYRPVEAEAWLAWATAQRGAGDPVSAEKNLEEAALAAEAGRHFEVLPLIAAQFIELSDSESKHLERAELWARRADAALEQLHRPDLRAEVDLALCVVRSNQGHLSEAEQLARRSIATFKALGRPRRTIAAKFLLGQVCSTQGKRAEALEHFSEVATVGAAVLGASHPVTLRAQNRAAFERYDLGDVVAAQGEVQATLTQLEADPETKRVVVALGLNYLSIVDSALGHHADAIAAAKRQLEIMISLRGAEDGYAARARESLALALREAGQLEAALAEHALARGIYEKTVREDHLARSNAASEFAQTQLRAGHAKEALEGLRAILPELEAKSGATHPRLLVVRVALAEARAATGDAAGALEALEHEPLSGDHPDVGRAWIALGQLRMAAKQPEAAAKALEEGMRILALRQAWPETRAGGMALLARLRGSCDDTRAAMALFDSSERKDPAWVKARPSLPARCR